MNRLEIEIANQQAEHPVQADRLEAAVRRVLVDKGIQRGEVSIAVTDDPTIHELNQRYLQHDYATDVLSFLLASAPALLEGEIVVSVDTAARMAPQYGWSTDDELLLYAIHGALHLVGFDDTTPEAAATMREKEQFYLSQFDVRPAGDGVPTRARFRDDEGAQGDADQ
jgi:probable rRNA maturation factor